MNESKHKSHIDSIEAMFNVYPNLIKFLNNAERTGYEEWTKYMNWINNQKILLQECLKKLREDYSYASIMPVIREVYENFWFIHLAMNGIEHYKYFKSKKGHDINKIYEKWINDFVKAKKRGDFKDVLNISKTNKRIRITYRGSRINFNGKETNEFIPLYYFLIDEYNPMEAYVGNEKKIIEKYLTPPYLFNRFILPNKNLNKTYFEFQNGIIPHLLLNKLITKREKQRVIIHYNFLSLWAHPNKFAFGESSYNLNQITHEKNENLYFDRLILLYIGNLTKMFVESFLKFLIRQEEENKISSSNQSELKKIKDKLKIFEDCASYFWFIFNKPSKFYKYNYAIHKIWRQHMFPKNIKKVKLSQIRDWEIPYYNDPLNILKEISRGCSNILLGTYEPELRWE